VPATLSRRPRRSRARRRRGSSWARRGRDRRARGRARRGAQRPQGEGAVEADPDAGLLGGHDFSLIGDPRVFIVRTRTARRLLTGRPSPLLLQRNGTGTSARRGGARAPPPNRSALGRSHNSDPHSKKKIEARPWRASISCAAAARSDTAISTWSISRSPTLVGAGEPRPRLYTGADWLGGLAVYIAAIGVDFEVLEPPELVDEIRLLAERFRRAAGRPSASVATADRTRPRRPLRSPAWLSRSARRPFSTRRWPTSSRASVTRSCSCTAIRPRPTCGATSFLISRSSAAASLPT